MSALDVLRFAVGAFRGHRLRTALSLVGVAIGVAAVVLLTSLGEGARVYVVEEFSQLGTNLVIFLPGKTETTGMAPIFGGAPRDLTLDDAAALVRRVRPIRRAAPLAIGEAPVRFGARSRTVTVAGTTVDMKRVRRLEIGIGQYLPEGDPHRAQRVCVIGAKIQAELFAGENPLGRTLRIGDERFRVIGVMRPRGESLGMDFDDIVHVPVASAMRMFDQTGLFRVLAEVGSHDEIEAAKEAGLAVLRERHDGFDDVTALTQDSVLATFDRILGILTLALGGIAAVSLSVAGVGIMNVMLVSVSERVREIGVLKAIGATPRQVRVAFLVEAALLSTAGGLVGLAVGLGCARAAVAVWPAFPASPPHWAVAGSMSLAILVGVTFGALPARRASRLDPVAALAGR